MAWSRCLASVSPSLLWTLPAAVVKATCWDHYAEGVVNETPEKALKNAFGWMQYEGHGPGDELLGEPLTTLELGSGRGNAVAALAAKGIDATGIDISPAQIKGAQDHWGHLPDARHLQGDVLQFLASADEQLGRGLLDLGSIVVYRPAGPAAGRP